MELNKLYPDCDLLKDGECGECYRHDICAAASLLPKLNQFNLLDDLSKTSFSFKMYNSNKDNFTRLPDEEKYKFCFRNIELINFLISLRSHIYEYMKDMYKWDHALFIGPISHLAKEFVQSGEEYLDIIYYYKNLLNITKNLTKSNECFKTYHIAKVIYKVLVDEYGYFKIPDYGTCENNEPVSEEDIENSGTSIKDWNQHMANLANDFIDYHNELDDDKVSEEDIDKALKQCTNKKYKEQHEEDRYDGTMVPYSKPAADKLIQDVINKVDNESPKPDYPREILSIDKNIHSIRIKPLESGDSKKTEDSNEEHDDVVVIHISEPMKKGEKLVKVDGQWGIQRDPSEEEIQSAIDSINRFNDLLMRDMSRRMNFIEDSRKRPIPRYRLLPQYLELCYDEYVLFPNLDLSDIPENHMIYKAIERAKDKYIVQYSILNVIFDIMTSNSVHIMRSTMNVQEVKKLFIDPIEMIYNGDNLYNVFDRILLYYTYLYVKYDDHNRRLSDIAYLILHSLSDTKRFRLISDKDESNTSVYYRKMFHFRYRYESFLEILR